MRNSFQTLAKNLLCPPGNGVYTIHTGQDKKDELHQSIFGTVIPSEVEKAWWNSLEKINQELKENPSTPIIFGLPSDCGGGIQRGANWGPLFIRLELLKAKDMLAAPFFDLGDVRVIPHLLHDRYVSQETIKECRQALYQDANKNLPVAPLSIAETFLDHLYASFPQAHVLGLGGDHSVSYPFIKAFMAKQKKLKRKTGILHFDAHTDLLSSRMGIDICFGTWAYHAREWCDNPSALVQVGLRSSGKSKEHWENTLQVKQYWAKEIKVEGPACIAEKISSYYKSLGIQDLYLSFDIDALDSSCAGATGTPEADGLFLHEVAIIIGEMRKYFKIAGADITEVAPFVRGLEIVSLEPNSTLLSAKLVASMLLESMFAGPPQGF